MKEDIEKVELFIKDFYKLDSLKPIKEFTKRDFLIVSIYIKDLCEDFLDTYKDLLDWSYVQENIKLTPGFIISHDKYLILDKLFIFYQRIYNEPIPDILKEHYKDLLEDIRISNLISWYFIRYTLDPIRKVYTPTLVPKETLTDKELIKALKLIPNYKLADRDDFGRVISGVVL